MPAPCGGCPPCCDQCVFSPQSVTVSGRTVPTVVVEQAVYGCVRPDAGDVVRYGGSLGQMRAGAFHRVTDVGAAFLATTNNELAAHL